MGHKYSICFMPIIKSAKKRMKQNIVRRVRNNNRRRLTHDVLKEFNKLIADKNVAEAAKKLPQVYKVIDLSAKNNIIPKNRASRMKSKAQLALTAIS